MRTHATVEAMKAHARRLDRDGAKIGLVPTMGALHAGHLSLVEAVRSAGATSVVVSIFVNPMQFGPNEDLDRYPRDMEGDLKKLEGMGVNAVFFPTPELMYPSGFQTEVEVTELTQGLCGADRPGHFLGVTTVVLKLFNIVRPHVAVFGEKDFQQLTALRTMARDLNLDVEVVGAPLVREPDGLAMSSRNLLLTPDDREEALGLSAGLFAAQDAYKAGERSASELLGAAHQQLAAHPRLEPEYLELRHYDDLRPLKSAEEPCVILGAVRVGKVRLIDNVILRRPV